MSGTLQCFHLFGSIPMYGNCIFLSGSRYNYYKSSSVWHYCFVWEIMIINFPLQACCEILKILLSCGNFSAKYLSGKDLHHALSLVCYSNAFIIRQKTDYLHFLQAIKIEIQLIFGNTCFFSYRFDLCVIADNTGCFAFFLYCRKYCVEVIHISRFRFFKQFLSSFQFIQ